MSVHAPRTSGQPREAGAKLSAGLIVMLALAAVLTLNAVLVFWRDMPRRDFGAFYFSGEAWHAGRSPYAAGRGDLPNLNPPGAIAAIFAPLARLPLRAAGAVWQILGAAALAFSAWRIARVLSLDVPAGLLALGVGLLTMAARYVWLEGQITWLLLAPATEAWIAYRAGARAAAGAWLGLVVAVKPFFALAAVVLGPVVALAAAAVSVGLTGLSFLIAPREIWREWMSLGPDISISWPLSASVWTLAARTTGAAPLDSVPWTGFGTLPTIIIVAILGVLTLAAVRLRDADGRWTGAVLVTLLASPLGWLYYLPIAAGGMVASWAAGRWSPWLTAAVLLCCVPMTVHFRAIDLGRVAAVTIGGTYTWALLFLLVGLRRGES